MYRFSRILTPLAALLLGACANMQSLDDSAPALSSEPPPAIDTTASEGARARDEALELREIVDLLQNGKGAQARAALVAYLQRNPGHAGASGMLQQLDADPIALLGKAHVLYTVQAGETLGDLAARFLGDPVRFIALARYNKIARPRSVQAGQVLKIPTATKFARAKASPLTVTEVPAGTIEPPLTDNPDDQRHTEAQRHQEQGIRLMGQGRREAALAAFDHALGLEAGLEPAKSQRDKLRVMLVEDYHRKAIVHYRNQQLDEALAFWDKALKLDPAFEPAKGYRIRALELQRRLKELESR
ncbi:MAG: LysM peptidoglycan-binding domain-containing protein [Pseudomonadota bacterium]